MASMGTNTIYFDSNIIKVSVTEQVINKTTTITESGGKVYFSVAPNCTYEVTLKDGYVINTIVSEINNSYISNIGNTSFDYLGNPVENDTITITSKQATSSTDTKPVYKRINGTWVKQDAFQRVSGAWVRISTKEAGNLLTTSNNEILQDSNGNNLEFKEI